jgi:prepilin-type N-terminal cleavage/methylation domain-containing protein/prepilin-type processing-associated H-X9-DG protein
MEMKTRSGFTMIEILVVIAILLILFGLLFPVYAESKRGALESVCVQNLEQSGRAITLYASDDNGVYPHAKDCLDVQNPAFFPQPIQVELRKMPMLSDAVLPYSHSLEIFHCPSDSGALFMERQFPYKANITSSAFAMCHDSYEYRTDLGLSDVTDTIMRNPSGVNVLADISGYWHGSGARLQSTDNLNDFREKVEDYRYNLLFADGHVKLHAYDQMQSAWKQG